MVCRRVDRLGLLWLLLCAPLWVMADDRQQIIYIESDELEIDEPRGISEYRGAVHFIQGDIELQADKVIVTERQRRLHRVVAYGQPVRLLRKTADGQGGMRAEAQKIEYLPGGDSLLLLGQARLWQGGNEFSGDLIEYHLRDETVIARSDKEKQGRVRIIIQTDKSVDKTAAAVAEDEAAAAAGTELP